MHSSRPDPQLIGREPEFTVFGMFEVVGSTEFKRWVRAQGDRGADARINALLRKLSMGHACDVRAVGNGVIEIRTHHGTGYRVNFLANQGWRWFCAAATRTASNATSNSPEI